jgi:hypothetical protein
VLRTNYTRKTKKRIKGIPIYVGEQIVGQVIGDTFYKSIAPNHYLKYPTRAIAFDIDSLKQAEEAGAKIVKIIDRRDGTIYRTTIQKIWEWGIPFNRGWGSQIYLEVYLWDKKSKYGGKS